MFNIMVSQPPEACKAISSGRQIFISNKEKGRRLTEEWKQHQRHPHKCKENNNDN